MTVTEADTLLVLTIAREARDQTPDYAIKIALTALIAHIEALTKQAKEARVPTEMRCPHCDALHVDHGIWAHERAHRTHLCLDCNKLFTPYAVGTIGIDPHVTCRSELETFKQSVATHVEQARQNLAQSNEMINKSQELVTRSLTLVAENHDLKDRVTYLEVELQRAREGVN